MTDSKKLSINESKFIIPKHLGYLDSIRAITAIYVCLHHAIAGNYYEYLKSTSNYFLKIIFVAFSYGHYAVDVFIVLSGFCLMLPAIRNQYTLPKGGIDFFKRRTWRILPPYYAAILICLLLISTLISEKTGFQWDKAIPVSFQDIFNHLVLIQDLMGESAHKINPVLWSISVEYRLYFLFPLLLIFWRQIGVFKTLALTISLSLFLVQIYHVLNLSVPDGCPHYLALFTFGMFAADVTFSTNSTLISIRKKIPWKTFTLLLTVITIIIGAKFRSLQLLPILDLLIGLWTASLLIMTALSYEKKTNGILGWKPLIFIGSFSYSLYLMHTPLQQLILKYLLVPLNLPPISTIFLLSVPGTLFILGFSYLFFLVFENPFIRKRSQHISPS